MGQAVGLQIDQEMVRLKGSREDVRRGFEQVVRRYGPDAYRIALGLVGSHEDALELSQEAFYRAYKNLHLLRCEASFFPWFYQILRRLCFTWLQEKKQRRAAAVSAEGQAPERAAGETDFAPDLLAQRSETREAVWKALGELSEHHREILILFHFENLSYDRIAQLLMCSKGTVMSRLYHARRHLKERLEREKGDLDL